MLIPMKKEKPEKRKIQESGFSLLEMLLVVMISAVVVTGGTKIASDWQDQAENAKAAAELMTVQQAAKAYVEASFMDIWQNQFGENGTDLSSITDFNGDGVIDENDLCCVGTAIELPIDQKTGNPHYLKSTVGGLPADFPSTNIFGQSMTVLLRDAGIVGGKKTIEIFTITTPPDSAAEARTLPETKAREVARLIGSKGGVLPERINLSPPTPGEEITSFYGAWKVGTDALAMLFSTSGYGSLLAPAASGGSRTGSYPIVYDTLPYQNDIRDDVLYKVSIPGQPELNRMETNLDMSGHEISNTSYLVADNVQVAQNFILEEGDRQAGITSMSGESMLVNGYIRIESGNTHISATTKYINAADAVLDPITGTIVDDRCKFQGGWRSGGGGLATIDPVAVGPCAVDGGVLTIAGNLDIDELIPNDATLYAQTLSTPEVTVFADAYAFIGDITTLESSGALSIQTNTLTLPESDLTVTGEATVTTLSTTSITADTFETWTANMAGPLTTGTLAVNSATAQTVAAATANIGGSIGTLTSCTAPISVLTPQDILASQGLSTWSCLPGTSLTIKNEVYYP